LATCSWRQLTVNQWDARTVGTSFAYTLEVTLHKFRTANFEAFLDDLGCKLVHAILGGIAKNVVNRTASILGRSMFADMLNAPVSELAMSDNINACEDFIDTRPLL